MRRCQGWCMRCNNALSQRNSTRYQIKGVQSLCSMRYQIKGVQSLCTGAAVEDPNM